MVITLATFAAQVSQEGPPDPYVYDAMISTYYDVSVVDDWSTTGSPAGVALLLWRRLNGQDTVATQVTLLGTNERGQTVDVPAGRSVTVRVPGNCAYLGCTVVLTGGTAPTFTGTVIADGNFGDDASSL